MFKGFSSNIVSFLSLFEEMNEMLFFIKDRRRRFLYANPAHIRHLRKGDLESILGKTDEDFYPSSLAQRYAFDDQKVIQQGISILSRTEIVRNSRGELRWHTTTKIPYRDLKGKIIGVLGLTKDLHLSCELTEQNQVIQKVLYYIENHFRDPIGNKDFAKISNLSVRQIERKFKQILGKTPKQYLLEKRLETAHQELLKGRSKISDIAMDYGFFDHSHFTKFYRRYYKKNPKSSRASWIANL